MACTAEPIFLALSYYLGSGERKLKHGKEKMAAI
jgi:hypothetical protein